MTNKSTIGEFIYDIHVPNIATFAHVRPGGLKSERSQPATEKERVKREERDRVHHEPAKQRASSSLHAVIPMPKPTHHDRANGINPHRRHSKVAASVPSSSPCSSSTEAFVHWGPLMERFAPPMPHPHDVAGQDCSTETDGDVCPYLLSLDSDEDCKSLSSYGSSSSCSANSIERRVSFAATLVTEVNTRPYTEDSEKRLLFYTQSETDR
jgi:hypothetical protein